MRCDCRNAPGFRIFRLRAEAVRHCSENLNQTTITPHSLHSIPRLSRPRDNHHWLFQGIRPGVLRDYERAGCIGLSSDLRGDPSKKTPVQKSKSSIPRYDNDGSGRAPSREIAMPPCAAIEYSLSWCEAGGIGRLRGKSPKKPHRFGPSPVAAGSCKSCPPAERSGPQPGNKASELQASLGCSGPALAHAAWTHGHTEPPECRRAVAKKSGSSHRRPHKDGPATSSRQRLFICIALHRSGNEVSFVKSHTRPCQTYAGQHKRHCSTPTSVSVQCHERDRGHNEKPASASSRRKPLPQKRTLAL